MIDVVVDDDLEGIFTPPDHIEEAVLAACQVSGYSGQEPELCIRFASDDEVRQLNATWRNKDKVTDVLSFPEQVAPDFDFEDSLGDIALAVPFIADEAGRLGLPQQDHALHLIVHSTLHLLGFDHIDDSDADEMQELEREAMRLLGLHDPYPLEQKMNPEIL
ncbi:putative rRNA maturation factor [Mariprofundus aestuarium]|uniref:Endoribonuclease YbeY n=1 Tax=Mariprofundus aestuarium TaxID=1921086 RepID=A0A2K8KVM5_MARES|nr:rRNA maturation RNase YbeY [Mariprofundus aestuarium]ATX78652.1 putative rRNA maturation factor [Mariprofundus aestuarium]